MGKKRIFIGVAWPYVNGDIHIGHLAGYLLPADIFARFHRYIGNDVLMVSGSDCFGTPITLEADKRKVHPREIVDEYHAKNVKLFKKLGISFDLYTKTDTENHKKIVQDVFLKLLKDGYIFKAEDEQYYSPEEKRFLPDRYVEGECPHCGYKEARSDQCDECGRVFSVGELKNPKSKLSGGTILIRKTEHYFLDWSRFQKFLEGYVGKAKNWRNWVLKETEGWLKRGLKPRPITRDLDWGVSIPSDRLPQDKRIEGAERKRFYVWFENIIGYLSASIEARPDSWENWWYDKDSLHAYFMGKDNLVFHTLFWPGELHGYDEELHLPDLPVINQFLNLEGQKFSKSKGIIIDSEYFADTYGLDALRFYLTLIAPEHADTNFSWADFVSKNNDLLIGNFGNFINRTLTLAQKLDFKKAKVDSEIVGEVQKHIDEAKAALAAAEFRKYAEIVLVISDFGNKYLAKEEPWFLKEKNAKKFEETLFNAVYVVLGLLLIAKPLVPDLADKLSSMLGVGIERWEEDLEKVLTQVKIGKVLPLFEKLDEKVIEREKSKISLPK